MKKKLLTLLLTIFALSTCVFTLTACNHEHSYTMEVIEPTCLNLGYNKYTCKCGNTYNDTFVNSLGHSFTNYISDNNATVDADGTKTATCDRDGCNQTDTITDEGTKLIPSQGLKFALNADQQSYSVTGLGTCTDTILVIPSNYENKPVTSIGELAFGDCDSLTSIEIPNSVTSIGNSAFYYCDSLTSVTIGNSVTSIGNSAFGYCISLTSIEIPNSVTSIGNGAFYYCDSLTSIEIPNSVTSIVDGAFYDCDSLTSIVIPNSVTSIGICAFSGCNSLTSIEIPNSVTSIGDSAFENCDSLTSIEIPNRVTSIGYMAFSGCNSLTSIKVNVNNTTYKDIDGNLYSKDGTTLIQYAIGKKQTTFSIPNSVTSIDFNAFLDCDNLTSVKIGIGVTSIGRDAFRGCTSLTSVTFADTTAWYTTSNFNDWGNKTGGTQISVTSPSTNATYFTSTYYNYYWYKK